MEEEKRKIAESFLYPILFIAVLWGIKLFEVYSEISLSQWGILPRTANGLFGIFTAPLLHGDVYHLGSNTLPIIILGMIILYFYRATSFILFGWIYFLTGILVWVAGDGSGFHIGASGLIYGFVSFLFFSGLFRKDRRSLALALLVTFVYGGMVWGIFPFYANVSWESHLFGALTGAFCAYYYRRLDPVSEEQYEWQTEDEKDQVDSGIPVTVSAKEFDSYFFNPASGQFKKDPQIESEGLKVVSFKYVYIESKKDDSNDNAKSA